MGMKCVALDLDGTTLDRQGKLSPENRRVIESAIERGVHVVIASGRSFGSLPSQVLEIPGIEYAVTSNGSAIYRLPEGERCHEFLMEPQTVDRLLERIPQELALEAFWQGRAYASRAYVEDPVRFGAVQRAVSYIQSTRTPMEDIRQFITAHRDELDSIQVVAGESGCRDKLWKELEDVPMDPELETIEAPFYIFSAGTTGKKSGDGSTSTTPKGWPTCSIVVYPPTTRRTPL